MKDFETQLNNAVRDLTTAMPKAKSEARRIISELLDAYRNLDIPMGVSQWRNHGDKYAYRKFFDKQIIKKWIENHPDVWQKDDYGTDHFWWVQNLLGDMGIDINSLAEDVKREKK